jgi:Ser/Thr protein kinase RdoA (MazF antagonist)
MAVKTEFTRDDFVSILSSYDLIGYVGSHLVEQGTVQTNYFVDTARGRFVLRYYESRSRESVLFESDLLAYLAARDYPCPGQVKDRRGAYVGLYRDRPYVIFQFVEGQHIEHPTADQHRQLVQKAAELQKLTLGFDSAYTSYRWNYTPDLCRTLARGEAERIDTEGAREKFAWLTGELAALDLPALLPRGICHCDFHFSNVLFREGEFVALLDFDDANYTYLPFDLVGLIEYRAWPHTNDRLDITAAREVVQEYTKHRPLQEAERHHLFDVYKLSVLFDCVWYFGRGSGVDFYERRKIESLNSLGRGRFTEGLFER